MAQEVTSDLLIFEPNDGGAGVRFAVSNATGRIEVPRGAQEQDRILITNPNSFSVFVRMGTSNVVATLNSMEILPGNSVLFRIPSGSQFKPPWLAAITASASHNGSISAICGKGQ